MGNSKSDQHKKSWPLLISIELGEGVWCMWKLNHTKFQQCTSNSFWDTAFWNVLTSTDFGSACYYQSSYNFWWDWLRTTSLTYLVALSMLFHLIYNLLWFNYFKVKGYLMRPSSFNYSKTDIFISVRIFVETLQSYIHQESEFKVGTAMELADINHSMTP